MKKIAKGMGASIPTEISNQDEMNRLLKRRDVLIAEINIYTTMLASSPTIERLQHRYATNEMLIRQGNPDYREVLRENQRNIEQEIRRVNEMNSRINSNRRELRSVNEQIGLDQGPQIQPAAPASAILSTQTGQGKQEKLKIISVQFPIDSRFDTSVKRLAFIRNKLNITPLKRSHKTPKYIKYRIHEANPNYKHFTKKYEDVSIIFERAPL